ncbi:MAG TPA: hypothetical protein VNL91_06505 [Thermoanaerobaculia bacterium]|nr:hypothetical protein [Thermoanaerobaculia bacterium]
MTRLCRTWLLLTLMLIATAAPAQMIPVDLEIGYRFLDLKGSSAMYRTQVNEQEGFVLRSLMFYSIAPDSGTRFTDSIRIDATDLGLAPASSLRVQAYRSEGYRLDLRFRRSREFSELPLFANPLAASGLTTGQHTFDRTRNMVDGDLELLRWRRIRPFVGYSWNKHDGPGTTTYHVGQDEFVLLQNLNDTASEFRAGAAFEFGSFAGEITQGWRRFSGRESLALSGPSAGNNPGPVLGQPIAVERVVRNSNTEADTPFTNVFVTGTAARAKVVATYSRFAAESDRSGVEDVAGSLASFALGRFYGGINETSTARAANTTWRGGARAEVQITSWLDFLSGFQREHRELEGSALVETLYLQSVSFGGVADPAGLRVILDSSSALERDEDVVNVGLLARPQGPWSLRAGYAASRYEVTVAPDLAEIVVGGSGGEKGTHDRRVDTLEIAAAYATPRVMLTASWKRDDADVPVLRTDYLGRDRYRVRAAWKAPKYFRIGVTADETRQTSDRPDIGYDSKIRQYSGEVEFAPAPSFRLRGAASQFKADSTLLVRRPENFVTDTSLRLEKGTGWDGGASWTFRRASLDASFGRFENEGTLPFTLERWRARLTFPVAAKTGLATEWSRDDYSDSATSLGDYEATRYGVYLRLMP